MTDMLPGLKEYQEDERVTRSGVRDRREIGLWRSLSDNKIVAALVVALVLWVSAKVSGLTNLPDAVSQHESRLTQVEAEVKTVRESQIRAEGSFKYIEESLKRMERAQERRR